MTAPTAERLREIRERVYLYPDEMDDVLAALDYVAERLRVYWHAGSVAAPEWMRIIPELIAYIEGRP